MAVCPDSREPVLRLKIRLTLKIEKKVTKQF